MKLQKTRQFASIYLLTFCVLGIVFLSGCAERSTQADKIETKSELDVKSTFRSLSLELADERIEILPNGTTSQSIWEYEYADCIMTITEKIAYKRSKAPFGGFNSDTFLPAWESIRTFSLADIDPSLLKSEGRHLKLHTLEHKNLIKEVSLYTEAYLSYYKAENGNAHPAKSDFTFNLITLFDKETPSNTPAKETLKALITHCQSN